MRKIVKTNTIRDCSNINVNKKLSQNYFVLKILEKNINV